jgi:5-methylcytosine-specific restriction endonuclease McrA
MVAANAYPALLLNADFQPMSYFPLSTLPWQRAVKAVVEDTFTVVSQYDAAVRSPSTVMRLPSVVAMRDYRPAARRRAAFTRFNVFLRDRFRCQYCGRPFPSAELTFDHVIRRAAGGETAWDNIVTACAPCNAGKDHRLLKPLTSPKEPTPGELVKAKRSFPPNYLHESWLDYLYWDCELEA